MTTTSQQLGNYILGEPIGRSGLAMVYRAVHATTARPVILKVIHRYFAAESEVIQSFLHELAAVQRLRHPHIVALEDYGTEGATAWLALEPVPGLTLKDAPPPPYPPDVAGEIATQVAVALEAAHAQGIFHRNLKPSNVFVTPEGSVKLADFAMATLGAGVHPLMRTALTTPMPTFMSPEHAAGDPLTPQSDVYALGTLVYWMLTGRVPFTGDTPETVLAKQLNAAPLAPSHLLPELTREIDAVVLKALAPFLPIRYATPAEFASALRQAVGLEDPSPLAGVFLPGEHLGVGGAGATRPAGAREDLTPSRVEQSFQRIWTPMPVSRLRSVLSLALAGVITAAVMTWVWQTNFAPLPLLPPPTSALSIDTAPGTWPSFRRDVRRTGADPGTAPKFQGEVRWTFRTEEPLLASPVVAGDLVYLPTGDRRVVALEAATGAVRWSAPTTGPVDSTPAIAGENLYVGLRDGRLLSLDARTGALLWEYHTGNPVLSSPTVAGGTVYFGSGDGRVYALDAATGALRWSFATGGWVISSPAVWEDLLIVGSRSGWVYFLKANNGERLFHFYTLGSVESAPAVADGRVYVGNDLRRFWALRTSERSAFLDRQIYAVHVQLFIWGMVPPPAPPKGMVWTKLAKGRFAGSPAVSPDAVYAGNEDGTLYAWSHEGEERWTFKAGGPVLSSPSLVGFTLYFGADDGKLYALDTATGRQQWAFATGGKVRGSPAVTADGIYVASSDGVLYALR